MKTLLLIWAIGIIIALPVVIAFCKAAKRGDKLNAKIFDENN